MRPDIKPELPLGKIFMWQDDTLYGKVFKRLDRPAIRNDLLKDLSRLKLSLFTGLDFSGKSYAYANSYDPHPGYHIAGSYARQTLNLDFGTGQGITVVGAGLKFEF